MLNLIKHNKNEKPPHNVELLMLIDNGIEYLWKIGTYNEYDYYKTVEWYELPVRIKIDKDYSYRQMQLEDFWNNK